MAHSRSRDYELDPGMRRQFPHVEFNSAQKIVTTQSVVVKTSNGTTAEERKEIQKKILALPVNELENLVEKI